MNWKEAGLMIALGMAAVAATARSDTKAPSRLSWGPVDFLKKGMRNVPWVNDPFFPDRHDFHVSGIVSGEMAFINGKWYRIGEQVDGYLVKSITADGVTIAKHAEVVVLKIGD